jgi:hypothetical protein
MHNVPTTAGNRGKSRPTILRYSLGSCAAVKIQAVLLCSRFMQSIEWQRTVIRVEMQTVSQKTVSLFASPHYDVGDMETAIVVRPTGDPDWQFRPQLARVFHGG